MSVCDNASPAGTAVDRCGDLNLCEVAVGSVEVLVRLNGSESAFMRISTQLQYGPLAPGVLFTPAWMFSHPHPTMSRIILVILALQCQPNNAVGAGHVKLHSEPELTCDDWEP